MLVEKTKCIPRCVLRHAVIKPMEGDNTKNCSREFSMAIINYVDEMVQRSSILDVVLLKPHKHPMIALHPLQAVDRLGNPAIDFPIGAVFGDNDPCGSEGSDDIVKNNKHFESGRSQIFKLIDCGHYMMYDKPEELSKLMISFFEGTVNGKFELKPRYEIACAPFPTPEPKKSKLNKV